MPYLFGRETSVADGDIEIRQVRQARGSDNFLILGGISDTGMTTGGLTMPLPFIAELDVDGSGYIWQKYFNIQDSYAVECIDDGNDDYLITIQGPQLQVIDFDHTSQTINDVYRDTSTYTSTTTTHLIHGQSIDKHGYCTVGCGMNCCSRRTWWISLASTNPDGYWQFTVFHYYSVSAQYVLQQFKSPTAISPQDSVTASTLVAQDHHVFIGGLFIDGSNNYYNAIVKYQYNEPTNGDTNINANSNRANLDWFFGTATGQTSSDYYYISKMEYSNQYLLCAAINEAQGRVQYYRINLDGNKDYEATGHSYLESTAQTGIKKIISIDGVSSTAFRAYLLYTTSNIVASCYVDFTGSTMDCYEITVGDLTSNLNNQDIFTAKYFQSVFYIGGSMNSISDTTTFTSTSFSIKYGFLFSSFTTQSCITITTNDPAQVTLTTETNTFSVQAITPANSKQSMSRPTYTVSDITLTTMIDNTNCIGTSTASVNFNKLADPSTLCPQTESLTIPQFTYTAQNGDTCSEPATDITYTVNLAGTVGFSPSCLGYTTATMVLDTTNCDLVTEIGNYSIRVQGTGPNRQYQLYDFEVQVGKCSCGTISCVNCVTNVLDEHYISNPTQLQAPVYKYQIWPMGCSISFAATFTGFEGTINYYYTLTLDSAVFPYDYYYSNLILSTDDNTLKDNIYAVDLTVQMDDDNTINTANTHYDLKLLSSCQIAKLTLKSMSGASFSGTFTYDVSQGTTETALEWDIEVDPSSCTEAITYTLVESTTGATPNTLVFTVDTAAKKFYVSTTDVTMKGVHSFKLTGLLYEYSALVTQDSQLFTVTITDNCAIVIPTQNDIEYTIESPELQSSLAKFREVEYSYCDSITYTVEFESGGLDNTVFSYINENDPPVVLKTETSNIKKDGDYQMRVSTTYKGGYYYYNFYAKLYCTVQTLTPSTLDDYTYRVGSGQLVIPFTGFKQSPDCGRGISYTVEMSDQSDLPDFISSRGNNIYVMSMNGNDTGVYYLVVKALVGNRDGSETENTDLEFELTVTYDPPEEEEDNSLDYSSNQQFLEEFYAFNSYTRNNDLNAEIVYINKYQEMMVRFDPDIRDPEKIYSEFNSSDLLIQVNYLDAQFPSRYYEISWEITQEIKDSEIYFKLDFTYEDYTEPDKLEIVIKNNSLFVDVQTGLSITYEYTMSETVPKQLKDDCNLIFFLISCRVKASSLEFLWRVINALQIIVHIPLFSIQTPANVTLFYYYLTFITNLDVLPSATITGYIFNFDEDEKGFNRNFEEFGYETMNTITNLQSMFLFFLIVVAVTMSFFMFRPIFRTPKLSALYNKFYKMIYWGLFFRFFLEGYINFALCSIIGFQNIKIDTTTNIIVTMFTILFGLMSFVFPFVIYGIIIYNNHYLDDEKYQVAFGALYDELNTVLMLIYTIHARPLEGGFNNFVEVINQYSVLAITYILLLFTDFGPEEEVQYQFGFIAMFFTFLNMLLNFGVMFFAVIVQFKNFFKRKCCKKKQQKQNQNQTKVEKLYKNENNNLEQQANINYQEIKNESNKPKQKKKAVSKKKKKFRKLKANKEIQRMNTPANNYLENIQNADLLEEFGDSMSLPLGANNLQQLNPHKNNNQNQPQNNQFQQKPQIEELKFQDFDENPFSYNFDIKSNLNNNVKSMNEYVPRIQPLKQSNDIQSQLTGKSSKKSRHSRRQLNKQAAEQQRQNYFID